jgi:heme/copper-type cytochrome/quinol oxidase subunit 2
MKKVLTILGAIFICLIVAGVIFFSGIYYYASRLDREAKAYVDEVVPIIVTSWNTKELINRASPEFFRLYPPRR